MCRLSLVGGTIAAACLLAATASLAAPSNYEAPGANPEAADKKLGVATLSAVVAANGTILRGAGAAPTVRLSTGTYEVRFQRDIRDCAYAVTAGSAAAGNPAYGVPVVAWRTNKPDGLWIQILDKNGGVIDRDFHVVVFCGW